MRKLINLPGVGVENSQKTEDTLILLVNSSDKKTALSAAVKKVIVFIKINGI